MSVAFGMFPTNSPNVYENTSMRVCAAQGIRLVSVGTGKWVYVQLPICVCI